MTLWQLALEILFLQVLATQSEMINDPTLKPHLPFDGISDAEQLRSARSNNEPDKEDEIWFQRTQAQRKIINDIFKKKYPGETLETSTGWAVHPSESGEDYDSLHYWSLWAPGDYLAEKLMGTTLQGCDERESREEIICGNDKDTKAQMESYYSKEFKQNIETMLGNICGDNAEYKHVMVQYCWKGLCQEKKMTPEQADNEAKALRAIDPDNDAEGFKKKLNELLDKNCEPDMKLIFQKYRQLAGGDGIEQATEKAYKNNEQAERAYWRLVKYIENTCWYYAYELQNAVHGKGTNVDKITRITLTRCERNLSCILKEFKNTYGLTFSERIKEEFRDSSRYLKSILYLFANA